MHNNEGLTTGKKIVILSLLSFIAILLLIVAIILPSGTRKVVNSRTIMIFIAGSDLESRGGLVSGDLDLIDEIFGSSVDINKSKPTNSEYIYTIADRLKIEMFK